MESCIILWNPRNSYQKPHEAPEATLQGRLLRVYGLQVGAPDRVVPHLRWEV